MQETYMDVMLQSLYKKIQVLDSIIEQNKIQKMQLEDTHASAEAFDKTVEKKAALVEQLEQLDNGFEKLYERVKEELKTNRSLYTDKIRKMQECIHMITAKSMEIQTQEARNRELMTQKFAMVRQKAKNLRTNTSAATKYYKNMMQLNYVTPQFLDNKQ